MPLKIKFIFNSLVVFLLLQTFFLIKPFSTKANFLKYSSNPILQIGNLGSWDSLQLYGPAIIENNGLKMWFSGSDGTKRQIGQATFLTSTDWQKNINNPIIDWGFVDSNDVGIEHPYLLYAPNLSALKYKMWFNNVNQFFHFKLKYSTSENGLIWNTPEDLIFDTTSEWDSEERTAPTMFQDTLSKYHMWFTAKGKYNSKTNWRVGYATSGDGINWTKHPEPVLEATEDWENVGARDGVGNPSVIYENGIYHMWYHADRDIGHATSSGGINWIKDKNNPVLSPSSDPDAFDSRRVMDPFILNKDGVYFMYYSGENRDGRWQIGLATSSAIAAPTSTPTPTPTNTPTPTPTNTPTPTPTLTPTPTGALFPPIVIVPGLGASWNPRDIFSCNLSSSGNWKMTPFTSVYKRLINTLTKNAKLKLNSDVFVYNYDWRQPLDKQGEKLKNYIDKILSGKPPGTKVRLLGHSLGGLVIRSYLINYPDSHRAESILTLGTPHQGTVLAYPLWEKGEIWTDDKTMKWILTNLINHCKLIRPGISSQIRLPQIRFRTPREVLQLLSPSIKSLLPTFNYLRQNGLVIEEETMKNRNNWLTSHQLTASSVSLNTLSGNNIATLRFLDIVDPSVKEKAAGDWLDGKPVKNETDSGGDGTILKFSSQLEAAQNNVISGNHSDVVYSTDGIGEILRFLNLPDVKPAEEMPMPEVASKNILAILLDQPIDFKIVDPKGVLSQSEENLIVQFEPRAGAYRLKIPPSTVPQANLYINLISTDKEDSQSFVLELKKGKESEFLLTFTNFKTPSFKLFPL